MLSSVSIRAGVAPTRSSWRIWIFLDFRCKAVRASGGYLIFDDLRALLESRTFIVGGDLNADPAMDDRPHFVGGNQEFFDGLERNGFVNLAAGSGPAHRGYKLDYVFGSRDFSPSVRTFRVDEKALELGLSDHAPLIVDLEVG